MANFDVPFHPRVYDWIHPFVSMLHAQQFRLFPTDMLRFGNNAANDFYTLKCKESSLKLHPARFPAALPEFFIVLLTSGGDIVLDPFAGSNTTGAVAERLQRRWLAVENVEDYLEASKFRFV